MRARSAAREGIAWLSSARPAPLLAALVLAQLGVFAWLAFRTPHNGWVWYSGGDATEYWTSQWSVAHGLIPPARVGWGLPVLYGWIPVVGGDSLLTGLPAVVILHALILGPLALVLVWALADRLYGRMYAWAVAALWTFGPLLAIWAFTPRFRPRFEENFLAPHWVGLTDMADFPSLIAVLAAAWSAVRAAQTGRFESALGSGVVAGIALGIKPANGYFLPALAVLLVAWRPRTALGWVAGVVPAVATLAVWKLRGLGTLPVLSAYEPMREASGIPLALTSNRYVPLDWHHLSIQWTELREVFWDLRFLQFVLVAGAFGALRRNVRVGLFLVVWFAAYCLLKGMSPQADINTTSYFRLTLPGFTALVLLIPAVGFLWPGTRSVPLIVKPESWTFTLRSPAAIATALLALLPLALVLITHPATAVRSVRDAAHNTEAPISALLTPKVAAAGATVRLTWKRAPRSDSTKVSYVLYRTTGTDGCTFPPSGATECVLVAPIVTSTSSNTVNDRPGRGRFWYRVAAVADYLAEPGATDLMLVSPAVAVNVG